MTTAQIDGARALKARIADSPAWFFRELLGADPYSMQLRIAESVRDNTRTSVAGCNGSGKDWAAGRLVLWWMLSRYPAKVVIMGPTHRQVADIVWKETRSAYYAARTQLGGRMLETPYWVIDDDSFAIGFSTDRWENIQGFHSPNLLVIITEAHAVDNDDVDALMKLQPRRVLMTGNTLVTGGAFYDSHHSKREDWTAISIAASDTPNIQAGRTIVPALITQEWIDDRAKDWGADSPVYRAAVNAEFPEDLEGTILTLRAAREASERTGNPDGPAVYACDVARSGDNKTIIVRRRGAVAEIVHKAQGHDTMRTVGVIKGLWDADKQSRVVIDAVGLGAGVVDRLRELDVPVVAYNGGEPARNPRGYVNRNAECWWSMREWVLGGGGCIPKDEALIGQLASRRYEIQSDRRIMLEKKDDMAKRGIRSPDEADALSMTFTQAAATGKIFSNHKRSSWRDDNRDERG